jgi:hypothetical protein
VAGQLAESILAKLDGAMQDIAGKQSIVDTNMQGSK